MRVKTRRQKTTYVESSRIVVSCESVCPRVWRMALLLVAFKKRKKLRTKTLFSRHTLCARARRGLDPYGFTPRTAADLRL